MKEIIKRLNELTDYNIIKLTDRGNTAIFAALYLARQSQLDSNKKITKKIVLIQDQGGWLTYKKYPKMLEMDVLKLKTDYGVIDLDILKKTVEENKNHISCILYAQPAGYFADQPIKEIYELCKKENILVIMDITGSIGTELAKTEYADIILASFGEGKPINLGYGGFIGIKDEKIYDSGKEIFKTINFDEKYGEELLKKLGALKDRHDFFYKIKKKILNDLKDYEIIHKDKKGINIIVKYKNNLEKEKIIEYCNQNKFEFVICPREWKVNVDAISIEVKRLL